jgi:hypothetical protein
VIELQEEGQHTGKEQKKSGKMAENSISGIDDIKILPDSETFKESENFKETGDSKSAEGKPATQDASCRDVTSLDANIYATFCALNQVVCFCGRVCVCVHL